VKVSVGERWLCSEVVSVGLLRERWLVRLGVENVLKV